MNDKSRKREGMFKAPYLSLAGTSPAVQETSRKTALDSPSDLPMPGVWLLAPVRQAEADGAEKAVKHTIIGIDSVTCLKCRMPASVDADKLCEFCRQRNREIALRPHRLFVVNCRGSKELSVPDWVYGGVLIVLAAMVALFTVWTKP